MKDLTKWIFIVLMSIAPGLLYAQQKNEAGAKPDFPTGPDVGERIDDFELRDQYGEQRRLRELLGNNGGLLNFFRSADW